MQIVGKPEKPKSREPLILLGLRLITQVLLPSGSSECKFKWVQVPFSAPNSRNPIFSGFCYFMYEKKILNQPTLQLILAIYNTYDKMNLNLF